VTGPLARPLACALLVGVAACGRTPVKLDPRDPYGVVLTLRTRMGVFPDVERRTSR
jgi:hypothetical protein